MMVLFDVYLSLIVISAHHLIIDGALPSEKSRLVGDLLRNYNKDVIPTIDPKGQIQVNISFALGRVEGLNEKDQMMTTFGWIAALWYDELLRWNPANYSGIESITLPYTEVWLPEISMMNSVNDGNDLGFVSKFRANVYADGLVFWAPGFKWETSCLLNLAYFPYDEHVCNVSFVNWMYGGNYLVYNAASSKVTMDIAIPNDSWNVTDTDIRASSFDVTTHGHTVSVPEIWFSLRLKRNPTYHTWNLLVPNLLMTLVSLLLFVMPSECGEKVSMGITVLLGYSVVLLMVSDITPQTGDTMPLISIYIVVSMMMVALCLALTLLVLNVHHHSPHTPPPAWVRHLIMAKLAAVMGLRRPDLDTPVNAVKPQKNQMIIEEIDQPDVKQKVVVPNDLSLPPYLVSYIKKKAGDDAAADEMEHNRALWQHLANVLDRFFLLVSFVINSALLVGFVYFIVNGESLQQASK